MNIGLDRKASILLCIANLILATQEEHNFDIDRIVTPVDVAAYQRLLYDSKFPQDRAEFLVQGFKTGFDIGYRGPRNVQIESSNMRLRVGTKVHLWNKVIAEVKEKRYAGPFAKCPYQNYIVSPLGLVPKQGGKMRLVFNLSKPQGRSLNHFTPKELTSTVYPDFQDSVRLCLKAGSGAFCAKSDLKSAFRILPIRVLDFPLLVMRVQHPDSGKYYYFVDKALPFGSSRSCQLFQEFSDSLAHIFRKKSGSETVNFLDDFFFSELIKAHCNRCVQIFLDVCKEIRFPVSMDKTVWATREIVFLGLLINTVLALVSIPADKLDKATKALEGIIRAKKVKVVQLQHLTGLLNFLSRAIVPGRAYTRRMYTKYAFPNLKQHHHVNVDAELRKDCIMWMQFLTHQTSVNRPFADFSASLQAPAVAFSTDASAANHLGYGGVVNNHYFFQSWPSNFVSNTAASIALLELIAVATATELFTQEFQNQRVTIWCDNQSVVSMINNTSSNCPKCLQLIRMITLTSLKYNTKYYCQYIRSKENVLPDLLSRLKLEKFKKLAPSYLDALPTPLPPSMWPLPQFLWE